MKTFDISQYPLDWFMLDWETCNWYFAYIELFIPLFAWSLKKINESILAKTQNLLENFNANKILLVKFGRFMVPKHVDS